MKSIKCPRCNATLMYDFEDKELRCNFCGKLCKIEEKNTDYGSSPIYSEKIDKAVKPQKILLFEIGLEEVKEKVREYLANSAFEYKDYVLEALKPVYLPYWMYDCTCVAEYEYWGIDLKYDRKNYLYSAKIDCGGILADASTKIEDSLSDQLDKYFDLSRLRDFDVSCLSGICAEEYDVTFNNVYDRLNEKLKSQVIEGELDFPWICIDKKINVSKIKSTYIQLPFYYAEVNGLKILVNGQTGDIAINSNEYLKTKKRLAFEEIIYSEAVQSKLNLIAFLGVVLIFLIVVVIGVIKARFFPEVDFGNIFSLIFIVGIIGCSIYYENNRVNTKKYRYIRKIIYNKRKELHLIDEVTRAKKNNVNKSDKYNTIVSWIGIIGGMFVLGVMIFGAKLLVTYMLTEDIGSNILIILILGGVIVYAIVKVLSLIIRCMWEIDSKL